MTLRYRITLPAGTHIVQFGQIPRLIAEAIHPPAPEGAGYMVSRILKVPRETDSTPVGRAEPLTEDDKALLCAIWAHLSPQRDTEWGAYEAAFEQSPHRPNWRPLPLRDGGSWQTDVSRIVTEQEHEEALPAAIRTGALVPLSAGMLPIPDALGDYLQRAGVTVENLQEYVAKFSIEVCVLPIADPERVSIRALVKALAEELIDQHPSGWMKKNRDNSLRRECAVSMTQVDVEAHIKRLVEDGRITPRSPINGLPLGETSSLEPDYYLSAADAERVRSALVNDAVSEQDNSDALALEVEGAAPVTQDAVRRVAGAAGTAATTPKDALWPVILLAQERCPEPDNVGSVWGALAALAHQDEPPSPLVGFVNGRGIRYTTDTGEAIFTKAALKGRMARDAKKSAR